VSLPDSGLLLHLCVAQFLRYYHFSSVCDCLGAILYCIVRKRGVAFCLLLDRDRDRPISVSKMEQCIWPADTGCSGWPTMPQRRTVLNRVYRLRQHMVCPLTVKDRSHNLSYLSDMCNKTLHATAGAIEVKEHLHQSSYLTSFHLNWTGQGPMDDFTFWFSGLLSPSMS